MLADCISGVMPSGLARFKTGEAPLRNITPAYEDGKKPLDHVELPPGRPRPLLTITTYDGSSCEALPSP